MPDLQNRWVILLFRLCYLPYSIHILMSIIERRLIPYNIYSNIVDTACTKYIIIVGKLTSNSFPGLGLTATLLTRISICPNCLMTCN